MKGIIPILLTMSLAVPVGLAVDMPDESTWGLCTAWNASETGRENSGGAVEDAPPFQWLQDQAEENDYDSVEAFCADQEHPGGEHVPGDGNPGDDHRP